MADSTSDLQLPDHLVPPEAPQVVDVECDGMRVSLSPNRLALEPGKPVLWKFKGVPDGWVPSIVFFDAETGHTGPFAALHQTRESVIADRNDGRSGCFSYRAVLRDARMPRFNVLVSPQAQLLQGPSVVIDVDVDLERCSFLIEPQTVVIRPGDRVRWQFDGLDPQLIPEICFYERIDGQGDTFEAPYFGPFDTLSWVDGGIEGSGQGEVRGKFCYFVDVSSLSFGKQRRALRSFNSEDPFVDNEKDAPDGDMDGDEDERPLPWR